MLTLKVVTREVETLRQNTWGDVVRLKKPIVFVIVTCEKCGHSAETELDRVYRLRQIIALAHNHEKTVCG